MDKTIEVSQIDTRYESFRLPNKKQEKNLLDSISTRGIESPLQGINAGGSFILLDGFKRLRSARKLGINIFPIEEIGNSESDAIIKLLKISNAKSLHILEQVKLVNDLHETHGLSVRDIAQRLDRSIGWVSSRRGILKNLGEKVWKAVFSGMLPPSSAINTLRLFKNVNKENQSDIDEFVDAVAGKGLRHQEIESLAHAWFKGGPQMREQIKRGDLAWTLKKGCELNPKTANNDELRENEKQIIRDLEIIQKYINRLITKLPFMKEGTPQYKSRAAMLMNGILGKQERLAVVFENLIQENIDDQCRGSTVNFEFASSRDNNLGNLSKS